MKKFLLIFCSILACCSAFAQLSVSNKGALISIKDGAFISVHGDYKSTDAGLVDNTDSIFLYGNWINDAGNTGFNPNAGGTVILNDGAQHIQGNNITHFGRLDLRGTDTKYGDLDVVVDVALLLNNKEFSLDTHTVTVTNTDPAAVTNVGDGFVSSLYDGGLSRKTNSTAEYWFPVGSSLGTARYRPIMATPQQASPWQYKVRMANVDPTLEGYDTEVRQPTICVVNEQYYHRIFSQGSGSNPASLRFYYDVADGAFQNIVHWQNQPQWEDVGTVSYIVGSPFNTLEVANWADFTLPAFALGNVSKPFIVHGTNEFCSGDTISFTIDENFNGYQFYNGTDLVQNGTDNIYIVNTLQSGDSIWAIGVDSTCIAYGSGALLTAWPLPSPDAGRDTTVYYGADVTLLGSGGLQYEWNPDSVISCVYCQSPLANVFEDTKFFLTTTNEYGCKAMDTVWIRTSGEIDPREVLFIPNAITPNGDGTNDNWNIRNLHLYPDNEIIILNRWGSEMYRQGPYSRNWDGTFKGTESPAGTYYYLIKLNNIGEVLTGPLTVIR
ncbi:hypothetical protein BH09BAC1_BH09BAC1_08070 [soil metagenome]